MDPWCWYIYICIIYANMTGVYGWDPWHTIAAPWIRHGLMYKNSMYIYIYCGWCNGRGLDTPVEDVPWIPWSNQDEKWGSSWTNNRRKVVHDRYGNDVKGQPYGSNKDHAPSALFPGTPQINPSWAFKQNAGCRGSWQTPLVKHADMAMTQPGLVHKVWEIDKSHHIYIIIYIIIYIYTHMIYIYIYIYMLISICQFIAWYCMESY